MNAELDENHLGPAAPTKGGNLTLLPNVSLHDRSKRAEDEGDRKVCSVCRVGILNVFASEARTGDNCRFIMTAIGSVARFFKKNP